MQAAQLLPQPARLLPLTYSPGGNYVFYCQETGNFAPGGDGGYQYFLDNLSIVNSCCTQISITPTIVQACIDGQAIVEYEVCLLNPGIGPVDINVQANVPPIPGITIVPGGGFDATGSATVTLPDLVGDPNCATLTLTLKVSAGVPPGTTVLIDLENDATSCDDHCGDVLLVLEECKGDTCEGLITVDHECRQKSEISWFDHITLYYQGFPIKNLNDPNCCVTWEYINGIPGCPARAPTGLRTRTSPP